MFARKRLVFPLYIHLTYIRYWKFNLKKGVKYETNYYLKNILIFNGVYHCGHYYTKRGGNVKFMSLVVSDNPFNQIVCGAFLVTKRKGKQI